MLIVIAGTSTAGAVTAEQIPRLRGTIVFVTTELCVLVVVFLFNLVVFVFVFVGVMVVVPLTFLQTVDAGGIVVVETVIVV